MHINDLSEIGFHARQLKYQIQIGKKKLLKYLVSYLYETWMFNVYFKIQA